MVACGLMSQLNLLHLATKVEILQTSSGPSSAYTLDLFMGHTACPAAQARILLGLGMLGYAQKKARLVNGLSALYLGSYIFYKILLLFC